MAKSAPAKTSAPKVARRPAAASPERSGLRWPLWTALGLSALYLIAHFDMIPFAFTLWGGLFSALLLGQ